MRRIYLWPCVLLAFFLALDAFQLGTTVIGSIHGVEHVIRTRLCLSLRLAAQLKHPQPVTFLVTVSCISTLTMIWMGWWGCVSLYAGRWMVREGWGDLFKVQLSIFLETYYSKAKPS